MLANVTNALMRVVHTDYERVESTCVFMCLFVNVETICLFVWRGHTREKCIATRKATRNRYENENEGERGEIRGEWNCQQKKDQYTMLVTMAHACLQAGVQVCAMLTSAWHDE